MIRAAVAALALGIAIGADAAVGHALARRGAERAEREASVCAEEAAANASARAARSAGAGRPSLGEDAGTVGCTGGLR